MFNSHKLLWQRQWGIFIGLLGVALLVRLPGLGGFITIDEPLWVVRSGHFLGGLLVTDYKCPPVEWGRTFEASGLACTLQIGYPGVTTMWSGSLGLWLYYWQAIRPTGVDLQTFLQTLNKDNIDAALIASMRLPLAIMGALFIPVLYLLLRRLLGNPVALVTALLVGLSPFHIALSRVIHHDGLMAMFMVLSVLMLAGYWLKGWCWHWLLLSAVMGGLGFLSKQVSWFMLPYVAVLGGVTLYYRWRAGAWREWLAVWRLTGEGILWGLLAALTFVIVFPAMWVIPGEVIRSLFDTSTGLAQEGHIHYFLGKVSPDPGPLYYPVGWLLQLSPVEVIGVVVVLGVIGWSVKSQLLKQQLHQRHVEVALVLFIGLFLLFETLISKKNVRYFLPGFLLIEVFIAWGLLWLSNRVCRWGVVGSRWALPLLSAIILLGHSWLVWSYYPYYFTYYNPLFGGVTNAVNLITVGWGEGMDQAGAYLNRQPHPELLSVVTCKNALPLAPFFDGQIQDCFDKSMTEMMKADYFVFYRSHIQRADGQELWAYFEKNYSPVYRANLAGLDYALVYRNPIDHEASSPDNSLPDVLTTFGYNLTEDGRLRLFWQNWSTETPQLMVGLASPTNGSIYWSNCPLAPNFVGQANKIRALVESECPLATTLAPSGLYNLQLGLMEESGVKPFESSGLGIVSVDSTQRFVSVELNEGLEKFAAAGMPAEAKLLNISFGDRLRLVGYKFKPPVWLAGEENQVSLYWQAAQRPDVGLAQALQVALYLKGEAGIEGKQALFSDMAKVQSLIRGQVISIDYSLSLPPTLLAKEYELGICLRIATNGETVAGLVADTSARIECLPLTVGVAKPK